MTCKFLDSCLTYEHPDIPINNNLLTRFFRWNDWFGDDFGITQDKLLLETANPRIAGNQYLTVLKSAISPFSKDPTIEAPYSAPDPNMLYKVVFKSDVEYSLGIAVRVNLQNSPEGFAIRFIELGTNDYYIQKREIRILFNGTLEFRDNVSGNLIFSTTITPIVVDTWHYIEVNFKLSVTGHMDLYIDGTLVTPRVNGDFSMTTNARPLFLAYSHASSNLGFPLASDTSLSFTDCYIIEEDGLGLTGIQGNDKIFTYAAFDNVTPSAGGSDFYVEWPSPMTLADVGTSETRTFVCYLPAGIVEGTPIAMYGVEYYAHAFNFTEASVDYGDQYTVRWELEDSSGTQEILELLSVTYDVGGNSEVWGVFQALNDLHLKFNGSAWTIADLNSAVFKITHDYEAANII